ncbi:BtrH N-terminal domain-containing protein [Brevibacillus migulae]|uniref:BtrH N-terminal domain-containing protein n=1 Tax=Brevibacillus migulae TaxID=1644114 RepID=UPI00106DE5F8|nr:BtrH N-terminal domain-containing protein [Brevibacillus migulae]
MVIPIKPVRDHLLNCFEATLATVAAWKQRESVFLFTSLWGFDFFKQDGNSPTRLGERLYNGSLPDDAIERYAGIETSQHVLSSIPELIDLLTQELNASRPVAMRMDGFWCPFHPLYQKRSFPHDFLVIGIDRPGKRLICLDPMFTSDIQHFAMDALPEATDIALTSFAFHPIVEWDMAPTALLQHALRILFAKSSGRNAFDMMRDFSEEVSKAVSIRTELEQGSTVTSPFFQELTAIEVNRKKYSILLHFLGERDQLDTLQHAATRMEEASRKWKVITNLFLKAVYMEDATSLLQKNARLIAEAASFEEKIAEELCRSTGFHLSYTS